MAAEGLPAGGPPGALPGWDLDAWYQDLEEVLAAAEPSGPSAPWGAEQAELVQLWGTERAGCELDAADLLTLLEPAGAAGAEPAGAPGSASSGASPRRPGSQDAAGAAAGRGAKRKRGGAGGANKELASERRVLELTAHNERLRAEIRRLGAEVARTRAALIERIVSLRRA